MIFQPLPIPSLSDTFGIPAKLAYNSKMPKEYSSPSPSNTRIERQHIKNETYILENSNGQRTMCGMKHWDLDVYVNGISRIKLSCSLIVKSLRNPQRLHTAIL